MSSFLAMVQTIFICGTIFGMTFLVLLALPNCKLRSICTEFMKYLGALGLIILIVCPIDLLPDVIPVAGLGDDVGYLAGAIAAVVSARKDRQARKSLSK